MNFFNFSSKSRNIFQMRLKVTEILYCACFSNKLVAELSYLCEMYTDGPFLDKVTLKNTT